MFQNPIQDPSLNVLLTNAIDGLYSQTPKATIDALITTADGLANWQSVYSPSTDVFPSYYYGSNSAYGFVIVGGTDTVAQGNALMSGYSTGNPFMSAQDINSYLTNIAGTIAGQPDFSGVATAPVTYCVGHSLGGAVASVLALYVQGRNLQAIHNLITFGSPKVGTSQFGDTLTGTFVCRWMNDDDPVPLVPPTVAQAPLIATVTDIITLLAYNSMRQTQGGLQLDINGVVSTQTLPTAAVISPTTSLANWLVSLITSATSPHNTVEYRRRLSLNVTPAQVLAVRTRRRGNEEPPDPTTRAAINAEVSPKVRTILGQGAAQNLIAVQIPEADAFRSLKLSGIWYVSFRGTVVCIGGTRRKASKLARLGNQFLGHLIKQANVDPNALSSEFSSWFSDAADPTSGIKPTMLVGGI